MRLFPHPPLMITQRNQMAETKKSASKSPAGKAGADAVQLLTAENK